MDRRRRRSGNWRQWWGGGSNADVGAAVADCSGSTGAIQNEQGCRSVASTGPVDGATGDSGATGAGNQNELTGQQVLI